MRKAAVLSTDLRRGRFAAVVGAAEGATVFMRMTAPVTVVTVVVVVASPGTRHLTSVYPTVGPVTSSMQTPLRRMSARKKAKVRCFPLRWRPNERRAAPIWRGNRVDPSRLDQVTSRDWFWSLNPVAVACLTPCSGVCVLSNLMVTEGEGPVVDSRERRSPRGSRV